MEGKVVPIRPGRRRRPIWFDVEDRERIIAKHGPLFRIIRDLVLKTHAEYPQTDATKKAIKAATLAEETGTLLYAGPGFWKALRKDTIGKVVKEIWVDKDAWIENFWFPLIAKLRGDILGAQLTPNKSSKEKWKKRLLVCGKTWSDVELGQDTIVKITARLCEEFLDQKNLTEQALEKRFIGWRKRTREKP